MSVEVVQVVRFPLAAQVALEFLSVALAALAVQWAQAANLALVALVAQVVALVHLPIKVHPPACLHQLRKARATILLSSAKSVSQVLMSSLTASAIQ